MTNGRKIYTVVWFEAGERCEKTFYDHGAARVLTAILRGTGEDAWIEEDWLLSDVSY